MPLASGGSTVRRDHVSGALSRAATELKGWRRSGESRKTQRTPIGRGAKDNGGGGFKKARCNDDGRNASSVAGRAVPQLESRGDVAGPLLAKAAAFGVPAEADCHGTARWPALANRMLTVKRTGSIRRNVVARVKIVFGATLIQVAEDFDDPRCAGRQNKTAETTTGWERCYATRKTDTAADPSITIV